MRKLNQPGRPKAVPCLIPRPPTPPHSLQVHTLKSILLSNQRQIRNLDQSNRNLTRPSQNTSTLQAFYTQPAMSHDQMSRKYFQGDNSSSMCSTSSSSSRGNTCLDVPEDAIEPNCDFPAPPEEFLEDIRANRKQEEIEGPLDASPSVTPPDSIASSDIDIRQDLHSIQRNSHSSNGYGSLNSSITEADPAECSSWSPSPTASPVTSPSHSSLDSASIQSLLYQPASSSSHHGDHHSSPSRFLFPPSHSTGPLITNKPCQQGVTLAPLLPCSLEREPIYQRLPLQRAAPSLSPKSPSPAPPAPHSPHAPPAPVSSSSGPTGTIARPPDYQTAMKRLSLAKANGAHHRPNPACNQHVVPLHAQNINTTSPLKAGPQFLVPSQAVPVATVNPRRQPSSPPLVRCNLTQPMAAISVSHANSSALDITFTSSPSSQSLNENMHCNRSTNKFACDEITSPCNESSVHDSPPGQQLPLPPRPAHSAVVMRGERVTSSKSQSTGAAAAATTTASLTSPLFSSRSSGTLNGSGGTRSLPATPGKGAGEGGAPLMKEKVRKRVSFSDQVELVAHSEDMIQEEHLPNPVLERVLGKAFLQYNHINNG